MLPLHNTSLHMQNSTRTSVKTVIAQALNSAEFKMLMDAFALPTFLRRCLGEQGLCEATREVWDQKCREYYEAMGSPAWLDWRDVLIPFGISFDNAPVHKAYRKEAVRPRVPLREEFRTLFEHAVTGLQFDIKAALDKAFKDMIKDSRDKAQKHRGKAHLAAVTAAAATAKHAKALQQRYGAIDFYVNCQFRCFPEETTDDEKLVANEVFERLMQAYGAARDAYRQQHGFDWCSKFRRDQALIDHRWLVFLPEQFMPLGNTTPDLHQVAEMLVGRYKSTIRSWAEGKFPDSSDLRLARNYDAVLHADCSARNVKQGNADSEDMEAIRGSIKRMWLACQVVAKPYGERFHPSRLQLNGRNANVIAQTTTEEIGTGGVFPGKRLS